MPKNRLLSRLMKRMARFAPRGPLQQAGRTLWRRLLRGADHAPAAPPLPAPLQEAQQQDPGSDASARADEGEFLEGEHLGAHGQRRYRLYLPPGRGGQALPLLVMLHGCQQDPEDFAAGTRMNQLAREQDCCVLYPAQSRRANPLRCWNWFQPRHQQRGQGEPALLAELTQAVIERYRIDPRRVYVAGLSAGGSMAAILAHRYPELFAALGVHSGLPPGAAHDVHSAFMAMRDGVPSPKAALHPPQLPTIVFHGDRDDTVHPHNARLLVDAALGTHAQAQLERGPRHSRTLYLGPDGQVLGEFWELHGSGHAWSGGSAQGSYTEPQGIDASREMLRFFMAHAKRGVPP